VGKKMTSMEKILGKKVPREGLIGRIAFHFKEVFQREWERKSLDGILINL
jgi:hypothetical protein